MAGKKRRPHGSGHVYRPKFKGPDGKQREQNVYWIGYRVDGKLIRESADTTVKKEAEGILLSRLAAVGAGLVTANSRSTTLADLQALVEADYRNNGRSTLRKVPERFESLIGHFGAARKAASIDDAALEAYKSARLKVAKPATVNRSLALLRRGFRLAMKMKRLARRPEFSLLTENNTRRGFFEDEQFDALIRHLPDWMAAVVTWLCWTGWRGGEARGLQWSQVDRRKKVIRIEDTKTRTPRTIPYGALPQLVEVIDAQWKRTEGLRAAGIIAPLVFHRDGEAIDDKRFYAAWHDGIKAAGLAGRIPHDFRRTAARNMLRAGIPQNVCMLIGGWKTPSIFQRYAIVDENLIAENLAKLAKARA